MGDCSECGIDPCMCSVLAGFPLQRRAMQAVIRSVVRRYGTEGLQAMWTVAHVVWPFLAQAPTNRTEVLWTLRRAKAIVRAAAIFLDAVEKETKAAPVLQRLSFQLLRGGRDG